MIRDDYIRLHIRNYSATYIILLHFYSSTFVYLRIYSSTIDVGRVVDQCPLLATNENFI